MTWAIRSAPPGRSRQALAPDGTWMIVEPMAGDRVEDNLNAVGRVYYGFSTFLCTPASLSQEVGLALGAQAGEARIARRRRRRRPDPIPAGGRDAVQPRLRSATVTRARYPDAEGFIERDGVRVFWEVYGTGEPAILLLPTWELVHSRTWKFQIPYFARRGRVVTFDRRGNGRSDRPDDVSAYDRREAVGDALAVLDAAAVERAAVVSWCGAGDDLILAAEHPERVRRLVLIAPDLLLTADPAELEGPVSVRRGTDDAGGLGQVEPPLLAA